MEFEDNWSVQYFAEQVQEIDGNIMTSRPIFIRKQMASNLGSII